MTTLSDEQLLTQVLCGDLSADAPAVRERVSASADFAAELVELRSLTAQLDEAAAEERAALAELARPAERPTPDAIGERLRRLAAEEPHPAAERTAPVAPPAPSTATPQTATEGGGNVLQGPWFKWAAAAAVLLLAAIGVRSLLDDPASPESPGGAVYLDSGASEVALNLEGERLSWSYEPAAGTEAVRIELYVEGEVEPRFTTLSTGTDCTLPNLEALAAGAPLRVVLTLIELGEARDILASKELDEL